MAWLLDGAEDFADFAFLELGSSFATLGGSTLAGLTSDVDAFEEGACGEEDCRARVKVGSDDRKA